MKGLVIVFANFIENGSHSTSTDSFRFRYFSLGKVIVAHNLEVLKRFTSLLNRLFSNIQTINSRLILTLNSNDSVLESGILKQTIR